MPQADQEQLDKTVRQALLKIKQIQDEQSAAEQEAKIISEFKALIEPTSDMGKLLNSYGGQDNAKLLQYALPHEAELSFCGFLEGDFSERSYLHTPISFSGGFFLRTHIANFLFDPGNGTIVGMRDMGIQLNPETDIIITSHFHPQARLDLHTILNMLGGYCPGRAFDDKNRKKKSVYLFSTEAVLQGRNDHPPLLIPSDKKIIRESFLTKPGNFWKITRSEEQCRVIPLKQYIEPDDDSLILSTFPAYHSEVAPEKKDREETAGASSPNSRKEEQDEAGLNGETVSCFFIQAKHYGILFTGDTECPVEKWSDAVIGRLKDQVTVLIANMKTIEYLNDGKRGLEWHDLRLTYNQLGFEGVKRLAGLLNPKALIIRALGLECVVAQEADGALKYAPQKLAIIREAMNLSLKTIQGNQTDYIIIPGRHQVFIRPQIQNNHVHITEKILVPAFAKTGLRRYGKKISKQKPSKSLFVTTNLSFATEIDLYIAELKQEDNDKPFLLIQGKTGSGKSLLAEAMATELNDGDNNKRPVLHYDLATAGIGDLFGADLFGYKKGAFTGAETDFEGYLGAEKAILILNQLEKLEPHQSAKFLDVLENQCYRQLGSTKDEHTNVILIFTSNIDIDAPDSKLTEDMKNRLRHRILNVPDLNSLSGEMRIREISEYIKFWCQQQGAVIEDRAWAILLNLDFSYGSFRMLNGLLHKAKWMTEKEYGLYRMAGKNQSPVYISRDFIEAARNNIGIPVAQELVNAEDGIPKELAWVMAVWISYSCAQNKTYKLIKGAKGGIMGAKDFNEKYLKPFRNAFKSADEAWNFFQTPAALAALEQDKCLELYVDRLKVKPVGKNLDDIFHVKVICDQYKLEKNQWLAERAENFIAIWNHPDEVKAKFLHTMRKL